MAKTRSFTLDLFGENPTPPAPGDLMRGPNKLYRVVSVRPVESRIWDERWKVEMTPLGWTRDLLDLIRSETAAGVDVGHFASYAPGEGPRDFARRAGESAGDPS